MVGRRWNPAGFRPAPAQPHDRAHIAGKKWHNPGVVEPGRREENEKRRGTVLVVYLF
jgi:hypothetical protein